MALFVAYVEQTGRDARAVPLSTFPVVVGRAPDAGVRVEGPGIWDRHLTLDLARGEGLVATAGEGALASIDGQPLARRLLRNGDEVRVGDATVRLLMAAPERRSQVLWGFLAGLLVAAALLIQAALLWELAR